MDSGPRGAVLIKVDLEGNEVWVKDLTAGEGNEFWDIMEDTDGGYVMAGGRFLSPINRATGEAIRAGLIVKTDPDGEVLWQHTFSSSEYESTLLSSAVVLPDGGYIFVGGATPAGEEYWDMLWLKLTTDGTTVPPADTGTLPTGANPPAREAISADTAGRVELLSTISGHDDKVIELAFSGDGLYLASAGLERTIKLWAVESWQETHTFSMSTVGFDCIALSPDGGLLASADAIWDVESGQVVHELERVRRGPGPVAFSPDGSVLAVALEGRPIKLWDVASGEVLRTFEERVDEVAFSIEFSPDGAQIATGVHGGMVRLYDVERGQLAGTLEYGVAHDVHDVAFSPDGSLLASAGTDETVRLWDVASGEPVHILRHRNGLYGVAFSPDGSLVAGACCDRTVKLWDVTSGRLLQTLRHADEVMTVAFSPDGTLLASGAYDHQIYLWGVSR
jgi:WD40 repeat protein